MRMTFAEWIREQKDICDKLKEQNYEDQKEIRNFFNDRIKRIFEIDLPKNKSYERIWGDNRDKNKRMYKALYGELKEDDIKFGEGEQRFFRAIFEIFSQSEDINNLKNNKWELYDLQQREKLWNIIEDMLEANDSWFVKELGWWGRHWDVENYLMEKIFVPHLYRIRKNLSKLKELSQKDIEKLLTFSVNTLIIFNPNAIKHYKSANISIEFTSSIPEYKINIDTSTNYIEPPSIDITILIETIRRYISDNNIENTQENYELIRRIFSEKIKETLKYNHAPKKELLLIRKVFNQS